MFHLFYQFLIPTFLWQHCWKNFKCKVWHFIYVSILPHIIKPQIMHARILHLYISFLKKLLSELYVKIWWVFNLNKVHHCCGRSQDWKVYQNVCVPEEEGPGHPGWPLMSAGFLPVSGQWPQTRCLVWFFSPEPEQKHRALLCGFVWSNITKHCDSVFCNKNHSNALSCK